MRFYLLCLLLLPVLRLPAQSILTGRVVNRVDGKPLSGVSVYINNSVAGTETDSLGRYRIYTTMKSFELIFSSVGFERQSFRIDRVGNSVWDVALTPRMEPMEGIAIRYASKDNWKKWGGLFQELLIGKSRFADQCVVLNPEDIWFRFNKQTQTLVARARAPLQVRNDALGYRIHYEVDSFSYSFQTNLIFRTGGLYFEALSPADSSQESEWRSNRRWAYRGSKMHFFRSVYSGRTAREGFRVYIFHSRPNLEKLRVRAMVNAMEASLYEKNKAQGVLPASLISSNKDSLRYYEDLLKMPDRVFYDSVPVEASERTWRRDSLAGLRFQSDTLLVFYREPIEVALREGKAGNARRYKGLSKSLREQYSFFTGQVPLDRQYTILALVDGEELLIARNGYTWGSLLFDDGYMAWKRLAQVLPWDYQPDE